MAAAFRAGGIGKLNRALIRSAQRNRRHPFRATKARAAAAPSGDDPLGLREWWNQTDVTKLVQDGFKDFGLSLASEGLHVGGKWVLGRLLDYWGLKDVKEFLLPKPDTEKIIEMIQELTKRVNNLQQTADTILKEVLAGQYDAATAPTVPLIDAIDTNQQEMVNLLKLKQEDPGRVGATKRILASVSSLEGQRNRLNLLLTNPIPGVTNILVAASKKAAAQNRWFRQAESQSVRDVYKYYAVYQLRLANLLVEYWNTRSCTNNSGATGLPVAYDDPARPRQAPSQHRAAKAAAQATAARRNVRRPPHDADVAAGFVAAQRLRRSQLDSNHGSRRPARSPHIDRAARAHATPRTPSRRGPTCPSPGWVRGATGSSRARTTTRA